MKRILSKHGEGKKMAKLFGTSEQVVTRALRYGSQSGLAQKIRAYALKNGGKEVEISD